MNLESLFENFHTSAFRLEGLSQYSIPEEQQAFQHFQSTQQLPVNFNDEWVHYVKDKTSKGRIIQRLRLISDELSNYEKFEIAAYRHHESGEDIKFIDRNNQPYQYDFWLFDNRWLAQMDYDKDGAFMHAQIVDASKKRNEIDYWLNLYKSL
jgi:hypothetical protein